MRSFSVALCITALLNSVACAVDSTLAVPQLVKPAATPAQGDPLQDKYDAAWARYDQTIAKVTESINKALDDLFNRAADAGNFDLAKMWDKKKKDFSDTRTLEWPTDGKAKTEWRKNFADIEFPEEFSESVASAQSGYAAAVKALKDDYKALEKEYTKERNLERAGKLREEVAALERKPPPPPTPQPAPRPRVVEDPKPPPKPWPVAKNGAQQFKGHWYKAFPDKLSWHQAKAKCEEFGGHLVIVGDAQEEAFVRNLAGNAGLLESVWLGVTDQGHEGRWVWVDGKPLAYSNWGRLQPNNKDNEEHYAVLRLAPGDWMDLPSAFPQMAIGFVCEWDE